MLVDQDLGRTVVATNSKEMDKAMGWVPLDLAWGESLVLALQSLKLVMQVSVKGQQEEMEDRMESDEVEMDLEFEKQVAAW